MTKKKVPSIECIRKRLRYEPEIGKLFWLDCDEMPNAWRARWAGKEAFTSDDGYGYRQGTINGIGSYKAHRVIFALYHGFWPENDIDHIDGDASNNRIENLRDVTKAINQKNKKMNKNNTSGHCGIRWVAKSSKWHARIGIGMRREKNIGFFATLEEAIAARAKVAKELGCTDRHGK